jgi:hypothetical protein
VFGWKKKRAANLQPEAQWFIEASGKSLAVRDPEGEFREVIKTDLSGVIIETNDTGPWGADVWWLLFGADDRLACAFPQGATGEQDAVDFLTGLEGFDHRSMISAMSSTHNASFRVWRKAP